MQGSRPTASFSSNGASVHPLQNNGTSIPGKPFGEAPLVLNYAQAPKQSRLSLSLQDLADHSN